MKSTTSNLLLRAVAWTLMALIIGLLIYQYRFNRSVWLDEAMLSLNIIEKSPLALFKSLGYNQVAPILFLLIEKCFTLLFGDGELALRLFPLISAILTLPLFFDFSSAITRHRMIPLVGLCLFACTPKFIYYASEVKQYASDMFVLCGIYFAAFSDSSFAVRNRRVLLTVTGAVAVFLSNVSIIPLTIVGGLLVYRCIRNEKDRPVYTLPLAVWAGCFGINFMVFVFHNPLSQVMKGYWSEFFMPFPWQSGFGDWITRRGVDLFSNLLPNPDLRLDHPGWPAPWLLSMIVYGGSLVYLLASKQFRLFYLCVGPVALHLLLSSLRFYPFDLRLVLYMVPLFLLVMATGLFELCNLLLFWLRKAWRPVPTLVLMAVFIWLFAYGIYDNYPYLFCSEDIKPVFSVMNKKMKDNYNVYVYYGAIPAYNYYQEIGYTHFGQAKIVKGTHPPTFDGYLTEMRSLKGPTWFLISHGTTAEEEQYILKGMGARGPKLMEFIGYGSRAYLFDLK